MKTNENIYVPGFSWGLAEASHETCKYIAKTMNPDDFKYLVGALFDRGEWGKSLKLIFAWGDLNPDKCFRFFDKALDLSLLESCNLYMLYHSYIKQGGLN